MFIHTQSNERGDTDIRSVDWTDIYLHKLAHIFDLSPSDRLEQLQLFLSHLEDRLQQIAGQLDYEAGKLHHLLLSRQTLSSDAGAFGLNPQSVRRLKAYQQKLNRSPGLKKELYTLFTFRQIASQSLHQFRTYGQNQRASTPASINQSEPIKKSA